MSEKPSPTPLVNADLLLHPVRMRILLAAAARQEVTAQQLAEDLPDIPQASLYRHVAVLAKAGILKLLQERRSEKTYAVQTEALTLSTEELAAAPAETHLRLFTQYLGMLLGYFSRYAAQGAPLDYVRDGVSYLLLPMNLSETEMKEMAQAFNAALLPFLKNEPSEERRRLIMGLVTMPDGEEKR